MYEFRSTILDHEIACLDIHSFDKSSDKSDLCAVGLWSDISARLLTVPNLEEIFNEQLKGGLKYNFLY